jgi:predicted N-acyltransferase
MPISNSFDFKIAHSVAEIDPDRWDQLSARQPFTSHQWYRYSETVMVDSKPSYLILYENNQPIARATFWRTANEPLPIKSAFLRNIMQFVLKRWPLLICESPFSSLSGVVLPESPLRAVVQSAIYERATELLHQQGCSFLVFIHLPKEQFSDWPENLLPVTGLDPGTVMQITWPSFEAYLEAGNKKDRQHYKKTVREAEKLGIIISRHSNIERIDEALDLIHGVEHRFGSPENPWARAMLEHFGMLPGATFLTATIDNRLVGCGLILEDNGAQMNTLLGLAQDIPYVYFMLVYESLKVAFDHHIQLLRLGSGAYDVKQQLGFSLEDNHSLLFSASNPLLQKAGQLLGKLS